MRNLDFSNDYLAGAHPQVLQRLVDTNLEHTIGYGQDAYCDAAKDAVRAACACPEAEVFFLVGGTQTNATCIDAMLRPWQGIIAPDSGHITTHEAGAIEHSGHKIIPVPQTLGKITAEDVAKVLAAYDNDDNREHTVMPGGVYISHPTEFGTLYTKAELEALRDVCRGHNIPLYMDGARLAYGLASYETDVDLPTIARCCDAFYIGGTKCGAMFGEALVVPHKGLLPHFFTLIKQHGALLAKGRLLGVQFLTLFTDDLYFKIGRHAIDMAQRLKDIIRNKGLQVWQETPTNQQFVVLENSVRAELSKHMGFAFWEPYDADHTVVRFATSWSTTEEDLDRLEALL